MPFLYYAGQCVTVCSAVGLQAYIFQSNRMRENIGASHLVKYWLEQGLIRTMKQMGYSVALHTGHEDAMTADIDLIYVGGGNAAFLCPTQEIARKVISVWSRCLLEEAPGLRVAVGYGNVHDSLAGAYRKALSELDHCAQALPFGAALYGLPVVRTCASTGLPAVAQGEDTEWISQSAVCKRQQVDIAQEDIAREFKSVLRPGQDFAVQLEDLGGREGQAHVAVVHADGNGVGQLLSCVMEDNSADDESFLHHIRLFSASVKRLANDALTGTLQHLQDALPLELLANREQVFPIRPIVYGGDDLTFVCDGRLGLALAAFYLQEFAKGKVNVGGQEKSVDACAGVAIVPTKFPFARAYDFAEELCQSAKSHRRQEQQEGSWLDFQIIPAGATGSITALRRAQYRSLEGQALHRRPYRVPETWDSFVRILVEFQSSRWSRSRAKTLLHALVQGPIATRHVIERAEWRGMMLPSVPGMDANEVKEGWTGGDVRDRSTRYFDPLETLDFYLNPQPASQTVGDVDEADRGRI